MREQGVLLGLVETMDLVDEQDRLLAVEGQPLAGLDDQSANLRDAAHDRGDGDHPCVCSVGQDPGQARLAVARRSPEEE